MGAGAAHGQGRAVVATLTHCEWLTCVVLREILQMQCAGTPDDSEIYADTATITGFFVERVASRATDVDEDLTESQRAHACREASTALTSMQAAGILAQYRYCDERPLEWEFTRAGREVFDVNTERRSCVNDRPC